MAYVLWRIFTKKYAKVRLGIIANLPVIPAERGVQLGKKETESWSLMDKGVIEDSVLSKDDNCKETCGEDKEEDKEKDEVDVEAEAEAEEVVEITRDQEGRRSRAKKVKSYLKKCKEALSSARDDSAGHKRSGSCNKQRQTASWYLQESSGLTIDSPPNVLPTRTSSLNRSPTQLTQIEPTSRKFGSESLLDSIDSNDNFQPNDEKNMNPSQHHSNNEITQNQFIIGCPFLSGGRGDVASLVKTLMGPIYGDNVLDLLTRQARDIFFCIYHGNLESFVENFLSPASRLLTKLKNYSNKNDGCVPDGWPLTLAGRGLIIQLGELESCTLRYGECYLCIRNKDNSRVGEFNSSVIKRELAIEKVNKKVTEEEVADKEGEEQVDIVEIALIWRSSMRSPTLNWEHEDNFMDWKDSSALKDYQSASSTSPTSRKRKKSVDETINNIISPSTSVKQKLPNYEIPAMRNSDSNSNSNNNSSSNSSSSKTEEAQISLEDLRKPICLQSIINNRYESSSMDLYDKNNYDDDDLISSIGKLLVTVERKIEHVNLDDIIFPCPTCRNIDTDDPLGCNCASGIEQMLKHNNSDGICDCDNLEIELNNSSSKPLKTKTFEVPGIKHIDSDDEEEVRMGFGVKRREDIIPSPRSIHDLPERVLRCGLFLPGCTDEVSGRLVLEFENVNSDSKEVICPREIASYILYLSKLYSSEYTRNGWTLLIRGGSNDDFEALDRALILIQDRINIREALLLCNGEDSSNVNLFPRTRLKIISLDDGTINQRIPRRKDVQYNYEEWITFYKEYDSLMNEWQSYGRQLVLEMSELKECANITGSLTSLNRLLLESTSRRASESMICLEERGETLSHLDYVLNAVERGKSVIKEVGDAATRLENCFESRRVTIRNFSMLKTIEEQASEVLSWLCKKGDILAKHARHAVTTLSAARLHERDFEKFYFTSMRHLDKGNDLAEEAGSSGLDDLANSLREHLRSFGSKLEDRREFLEDTSRCYLLIDQAQQWIKNCQMNLDQKDGMETFENSIIYLPPEHFDEISNLAEKLENQMLIEQCQIIRNKYQQLVEITKKNCQSQSPATVRRSFTTSESVGESNLWDDNDSSGIMDNRSYTLSTDPTGTCQSSLDNIGEFCESTAFRSDSPSRSSPNRRLVKPPVNSHLQRSPSIAPAGMKAKKTILLIMREMIQTERDYVKSLEYIIENYIPELVREDIPQALRGQRNVIFGNVEKIYEFHSQHFLRELEQCEHSPMNVGQCFLRHENKFYLYALYNKNKPNSDSLMAEYGTTFFKAKQLELGDKMDLASYLLKPVQRMGKYALLLQQLVKAGTDLSEQLTGKNNTSNSRNNNKSNSNPNTNNNSGSNNNMNNNVIVNNDNKIKEEDDPVKPLVEGEADLRAAEQMVRFQLRHGNDLLAMDSLRDCDVNVKEQGRLLRQNEFLVWQGKGKKCLRQVFLFEDLILFSKARRFPDRKNLDIYIYKHSIKTTDIGLTAVIADSPTKFEIWFRKRKPGDTYTLQCASEDIKKSWTEELSNLLWKQALRNREVRLAEMSSMGIGNKPCLDIRPSADQINDRSISVAQLSKTPRFRNSIAISVSDDSNRCSRRPHSVISVSSSSSSGGSSGGPPTTLQLGLDASPRMHHRSTTLNSQCSIESGIIADISILSDDGDHWKSTLESPTSSHPPNTSTPLQSLNSSYVLTPAINSAPVNSNSNSSSSSTSSSSSSSAADNNPYLSINL